MKKRFFLTRLLQITRVDGSTHFRELGDEPTAISLYSRCHGRKERHSRPGGARHAWGVAAQ
jgi:hypothetical protein